MPSAADVIEAWLRSDQPAVVFDFNGTLSDDEHILFDIFSELFRAHLGWAMTAEDYRDELLGRSDREIIERAVARHGGGTEDKVTELLRLRQGVYKQKVADHNPIGAAATQLVELLADYRIPVGIVTGAQREDVLAVLDGSPTGELITVLIAEEDVSNGKPHPEGFLTAARILNRRVGDVLVFEDSVPGVRACIASPSARASPAGSFAPRLRRSCPSCRLTSSRTRSAAGVAGRGTRFHSRLDADPRPVGAVVVAGEFDGDAVLGEGRPGDQQQRTSRFDTQEFGLLVVGLGRLEFFIGRERRGVVLAHHRIQRAGEIGGEQAGKHGGGQVGLLEHDRLAVGQPGPQDLVYLRTAAQAEGLPDIGGGAARRRTQHLRTSLDMDAAHLLGEPGKARVVELESRCGDEVATEAAPPAIDEALGFDRAERLAQGHPADPQRVGDLDLGRQLVSGRQCAGDDQLLEPTADAHMGGQLGSA